MAFQNRDQVLAMPYALLRSLNDLLTFLQRLTDNLYRNIQGADVRHALQIASRDVGRAERPITLQSRYSHT